MKKWQKTSITLGLILILFMSISQMENQDQARSLFLASLITVITSMVKGEYPFSKRIYALLAGLGTALVICYLAPMILIDWALSPGVILDESTRITISLLVGGSVLIGCAAGFYVPKTILGHGEKNKSQTSAIEGAREPKG